MGKGSKAATLGAAAHLRNQPMREGATPTLPRHSSCEAVKMAYAPRSLADYAGVPQRLASPSLSLIAQ